MSEEVPYGFHIMEDAAVTAKVKSQQYDYPQEGGKLPDDVPIAITGETVCCQEKQRIPIERLAVGNRALSANFPVNSSDLFTEIRALMERKRNEFLRHGNKIYNSVQSKRRPKIQENYEDFPVEIKRARLTDTSVSYLHQKLIADPDENFAALLTNFRSVTVRGHQVVLHKRGYVFVRAAVGVYRPCQVDKLGPYDEILAINGTHTKVVAEEVSDVCRVDPTRYPKPCRLSRECVEDWGYHPHAVAITVQLEFGFPFFLSRLLVLPPLPERYLYNSL